MTKRQFPIKLPPLPDKSLCKSNTMRPVSPRKKPIMGQTSYLPGYRFAIGISPPSLLGDVTPVNKNPSKNNENINIEEMMKIYKVIIL